MLDVMQSFLTSSRAFAAASLVLVTGCGTAVGAEPALLESSEEREAPATSSLVTALDDGSREALARAGFPVLLFPARYRSQVITAEGEPWAAVNATDDGLHLSLHGSARAHSVLSEEEVANLPTPRTLVRGGPAWVTLNEQIRSVAWHEGAIAWSLEVECDRPFDDTRCTEEDFVLRLAESLERVDPQSAGGAR
ncbi:MAG: hypothetical protein J0L92_27805 [Deltaproteobacteria bacterium]|nr:hypothetical protein [Deltaproteobacteria bacterium]